MSAPIPITCPFRDIVLQSSSVLKPRLWQAHQFLTEENSIGILCTRNSTRIQAVLSRGVALIFPRNFASVTSMDPTEIKALRSKLGLTQEALARELGVSVSAVQKWEGGRATPRGLYHRALVELARSRQGQRRLS